MPDYTAEIEQIEKVLNEGLKSAVVDGVTVNYDLGHLRKRLNELRRLNTATRGDRFSSLRGIGATTSGSTQARLA